MKELSMNDELIDFLNDKKEKKQTTEFLYLKAAEAFQSTKLKPKESQSNQERLAFLKSITFTSASILVLSQVTGEYHDFQVLDNYLTNEAIVGSLNSLGESASRISNHVPDVMKEKTVDFFMELTKILDPNKIDLATPLGYIATFGSSSAAVRGMNLSKRRFYEEEIGKYSDDEMSSKEQTAKYAIEKFANFTDEYKFKKTLIGITPFSRMGLFVANIVVDMFKALTSPKKTLEKAFLTSKMTANEISYMMSKDFKKILKKNEYIRKFHNLDEKYNPAKKAKFISSTDTFKYQDIDATSEIGSLDMVFGAVQSAYDDTLKINVKNSLSKSLAKIGDEKSSKTEKKEALSILVKISDLHKNTEDNRFDHYKVLSEIANDYLKKIKRDKKVLSFKPSEDEDKKTNFGLAREFVNRKQDEKLKILSLKNEIDESDPNQNIVDEMKFSDLFDIAVKHQLEKLEKDDKNVDQFHKNKNKEIKRKNNKNVFK